MGKGKTLPLGGKGEREKGKQDKMPVTDFIDDKMTKWFSREVCPAVRRQVSAVLNSQGPHGSDCHSSEMSQKSVCLARLLSTLRLRPSYGSFVSLVVSPLAAKVTTHSYRIS